MYLSTKVLVMSGRPGTIVGTFDVPFPMPRDPDIRFTAGVRRARRPRFHALREGHKLMVTLQERPSESSPAPQQPCKPRRGCPLAAGRGVRHTDRPLVPGVLGATTTKYAVRVISCPIRIRFSRRCQRHPAQRQPDGSSTPLWPHSAGQVALDGARDRDRDRRRVGDADGAGEVGRAVALPLRGRAAVRPDPRAGPADRRARSATASSPG